MTYSLAMSAADQALIERYAARENLSVPDFMLRTTLDAIKSRAHVSRPKARDEMTDEEFNAMLEEGYQQSLREEGIPLDQAFDEIRKELGLDTI